MPSPAVLITGATRGIGRHLALDLARYGCRVFATGRGAEALESLAAEARSAGLTIEPLVLDVADAASIQAAARAVRERTEGAGIEVLINNAGYGQAGPLLDLSDAKLREQFEVNVFGLLAVTRAFVPDMIDRGRGTVINVGSTGGRFAAPFFGAYHGTKYALEAMSDSLRMELADFGVRVVLIEPGPVESSFAERAIESLPEQREGSRWAAVYARADALRTQSDRLAVGPEKVAIAVRRAISARRPKARYLVPALRFELLFLLFALLPTRIKDAMFRAVFGLGRGPARAAAERSLPRAAG